MALRQREILKSGIVLYYLVMENTIEISDFAKVEMRVGTIKECVPVEGSEKLLKLKVDFGGFGERQILSGIAKWYQPAELVEQQVLFVVNLAPRKMMGLESQGMIMAVDAGEEKPVLITPKEPVENGVKVK